MSCRCAGDGECMCSRERLAHCPPNAMCAKCLLAALGEPAAECHESVCHQFPELCKCRQSPNIAKPGEW